HLLLTSIRHPPPTPLFPYTTLFRSSPPRQSIRSFTPLSAVPESAICVIKAPSAPSSAFFLTLPSSSSISALKKRISIKAFPPPRSEEHTSELQSRFDLVSRLLRRKK